MRSHTDGYAVEVCRLEDDGVGIVVDTAVFAAFDTGHRRRLFTVTDDQHLRGELPVDAFKSHDRFAFFSVADDDLVVLHVPEIKGMQRLAEFEHDIVCDVNNVVDCPHTTGPQTLSEPTRGGFDAYIFDHASHITRAKDWIVNPDTQVVVNVVAGTLDHRLVEVEGYIEGHRSLPSQSNDRQTVRAIWSDLELYGCIIKADGGADISTQRRGGLFTFEDKDPLRIGVGEIVFCKAEFAKRAEHTVALDAPEHILADVHIAGEGGTGFCHRDNIAGFYIFGAGADSQRFPFSDIHRADHQMVCIWMGFD